MRHSQEIDQIAPALVAALPLIEAPTRTRVGRNPLTGEEYLYADLADDLAAAKGPLAGHGIALMQEFVTAPHAVIVTTRLQHSSGQFFESEPLELPRTGDPSAHEVGALITYGRRYQAEGMLGMSAQHDSDASSAGLPPSSRGSASAPPAEANVSGSAPETPVPAAARSAAPQQRRDAAGTGARSDVRKPTQAQAGGIRRRLKTLGWEDEYADRFITETIGHTPAKTFDEASDLIDALEREIKRAGK